MSKYLCVGLAKEIVVGVLNEEMAKDIEKDFLKKFDKDIYDVTYDIRDENSLSYVIFKLKEDLMAEYAIDLMIEQHKNFIKSKDSEDAIEYFTKIKNKDKKEIINLINTENNHYLYTFRFGMFGFNIGFLFEKDVNAYITEFTTFHRSEKTFMEEYSTFFRYMRNILINSTNNPLKTALVVSL